MRMLGILLMGVIACGSSSSEKPIYEVCSSDYDCSTQRCVQRYLGHSATCTQPCDPANVTCPANGSAGVICALDAADNSQGWLCWPQ